MQYPLLALVALLGTAPMAQPSHHSGDGQPAIAQQAIAKDNAKRASDAEIRKRIITESIESYPGNCACPYQSASNGSRCGRRSAYDREGGYGPLCYPKDVSDEMVSDYRRRTNE